MTHPASVQIRPAAAPSFARWRAMWRSPLSFLRALQYERLATVTLEGTVLDIGGGELAGYRPLLTGATRIESVNIAASMDPTVVADLNAPLPFADDSFDSAVSLNTFEHIRNDELAIREMVRVLRSGAAFHVFVPFLYRVHGSPFDFHRHTAMWWAELLTSLGIAPDAIGIEPLVWDPVVTAYSVIEFNPLRKVIRPIVLGRALVTRKRTAQRPAWWSDLAMGYYVTAVVP